MKFFPISSCKGLFRTISDIYDEAFSAEIVNRAVIAPLVVTYFCTKALLKAFDWALDTSLTWNIVSVNPHF